MTQLIVWEKNRRGIKQSTYQGMSEADSAKAYVARLYAETELQPIFDHETRYIVVEDESGVQTTFRITVFRTLDVHATNSVPPGHGEK